MPHDLGVGALELLDDLEALVELGEDVHHGAGEERVLRGLLELRGGAGQEGTVRAGQAPSTPSWPPGGQRTLTTWRGGTEYPDGRLPPLKVVTEATGWVERWTLTADCAHLKGNGCPRWTPVGTPRERGHYGQTGSVVTC